MSELISHPKMFLRMRNREAQIQLNHDQHRGLVFKRIDLSQLKALKLSFLWDLFNLNRRLHFQA